MPKSVSIFSLLFLLGFVVSLGRTTEPQKANAAEKTVTTIVQKDATAGRAKATKTLAPMILIHGYLANKMFVESPDVTFPDGLTNCPRQWKRQKAWIRPLLAHRFTDLNLQECLLHMLSLRYDPTTKKYSNQPNVNVTLFGESKFGSVWPMSCLLSSDNLFGSFGCQISTWLKTNESQFMPMVQHFEKKHRYVRDITLLGAPYDWRRTANMAEMDAYFANLTTLIENAVNTTGQKAFLVPHSMGNLVVNYFLNRKIGKEWQQKYLNGTINVSAPWGGTTVLVEQLLSGNADRLQFGGSFIVPNPVVRNFLRTLASTAALLPNTWAFPANQTLAIVNGTAYSTGNLDAFLALAQSAHFAPLYHELTESVDAHKHTPMYCVHSNIGKKMPILFNYTKGIDNPPHVESFGEGDLLVNIESLRVCNKWMEQGKETVKKVVEIEGPTHMAILHEDEFYEAVEGILGLI